MVDWGAYPDAEEEEVASGLNMKWLSSKWVRIITVAVFLVGVALIIAGSVMLGIGVNKNNQGCPAISASPFYATVESTDLTYNDVISNYSYASEVITNQVRYAALNQQASFAAAQQASFAAAATNSDPVVTVLGMSKSPSGNVMAVVGIAFTTADAVPPATLEKNLNNAPHLSLYNTGNTAANSTNQQMCSSVSMYTENPKTNNATTISTTTTTPKECDCSCGTSTVAMPTTTESSSTTTTTPAIPLTSTPKTSTSSSTVTTTTSPVTSPTSTKSVTAPTSTSTRSSTVTTTTSTASSTTSSSTVTTSTLPVTSPTSPETTTSPTVSTSASTVTVTTSPGTSSSITDRSTQISSSTVTLTAIPVTSTSDLAESTTVTASTSPVTYPTSTVKIETTSSTSSTTVTTPAVSTSFSSSTGPASTSSSPITSTSQVATSTTQTSTAATSTSPSTTSSASSSAGTTPPVPSTSSSASTSASTLTTTIPSTPTQSISTLTTALPSTSTVSTTVTITPVTSQTSSSTSSSTVITSTSSTSTSTSSQASTSLMTTVGSTTTAAATTSACVWSSDAPSVPNRPGARDIVVLIDDSTAVGGYQNYSQVTTWLAKQLFPLWPVSDERWEAAPAQYAEHEYNLLMDFDATSSSELSKAVVNSVYSGRNVPSVTKALKSTMSLGGRQGVKRFVLLISASSNLTDLESALPLAETIRQSGSDIITLALGEADTGILGMLSSGPNYDFSSNSVTLTSDQATAITDLIQGQDTESTVSTTVPPTTQPTFDFPCHPDISVVVDTSSAVPSDDEYQRQLSFIAETLAPSWTIGTKGVEAEIVVFSTSYGGSLGLGAFAYQNWQQFAGIVHQFDSYHNRVAIPSIAGSLEYLVSTEDNRRPGRTPTSLLFTYSGAYHDVAAAQTTLSSLGNLIVISMGNNSQYLSSLSGNVITGMAYGDSMTTAINSMLCQPSSPVPLTSTVIPTSTTTASSSTRITSTQQTTTSVAPMTCLDCYPDEANVLVVMDSSSMMMGGKLDQLKYFVNNQLTPSWNHPKRLAILSFDDKTHFDSPVDFGDLNSMSEFHQLVSTAPQLPNPPSLASAFQRSLTNFHPISGYGQMNTVIFTISTNDAQSANSYATQLNQKGNVVIVAMETTDLKALSPLSNNVVSWPSLNDTTGIADQIEAYLNSGAPVTGKSTTTTPSINGSSITTTVGSTSEATTTMPHVTPSVSCGRDVILMVDESNAFPDLASFQKVQSWLTSTLIPMWDVSPTSIAVAPYGFTNKTFDDLGGDFQVQSPQELELILKDNLFYRPNNPPGLTSALRKAAAVQTPQPSAATVLISASDASGDVTTASQYANQLKQGGGIVITLAVGQNTNGQLHLLSSGPKFSFNSQQYDISSDIALEISEMLCASAPTGPTTQATTTTASTTTTTVPPPFNCNPDVALLFDNSGVNSNASQLSDLVLYTANSLVNDWVVGLQATEASIVMANANAGAFDWYPWQYQSKFKLEQALRDMSAEFYGGLASITNMLTNVAFVASSRRQNQPFSIVMFTFSSDYQDVLAAIPKAQSLNANIVAVGLGTSDPNVLGLLTGNVITGLAPGAILSQAIDAAICNPKPPSIVVTTSSSAVPTTSTSSTITTTLALTTTEPTPIGCPDCFPSLSNILILMDNSNDQSPHTFSDQQQAVVSLVSEWNHFERVGLSSFASSLQTLISYNDLTKNELSSLVKTIHNLKQTAIAVDLGRSLHMATGIIPDVDYGEQKTILFTATDAVSDKATSAAATLRSKGQLIVVGVGLSDMGALGSLASSGDAIAWANVDQPQDVVASIMNALGATTRPTPNLETTTMALTTTSGTTVTQPTICSQNLLLLLDESSAFPSAVEFNQLKTWVINKLLTGIPPTAVGPYGYADKDWNQITGGSFLTGMNSLEMLINYTYTYKPQDMPNIASALKKAAAVQVDGSLTTVIISASAGADDVTKAVPFSNSLKEEGAVVTLMLGGNGDLSALASDPSLALTSASFTPDRSVIAKIASVLCVPYTPPSTAATTTQSTTSTMSTGPTTGHTTASPTVPSTSTVSPKTSTSPSTTTTTMTSTTIIPDASYNPSMADIVILFDVSSAVNQTTLTAQKNLITSLVSKWNHFERMAMMDYAANQNAMSEFGDFSSAADVVVYLQIAQLQYTLSDLSGALKFAKKHYAVQSGMPSRNVILMTASEDSASDAHQAAANLQSEGNLVVVSLGLKDTTALTPLASSGCMVAFNDFANVDTVAAQINQLLGQSDVTPAPSTLPTTTLITTTTSPQQLCSQNLLLLLDESHAFPSTIEFNQLKTWVINKLLTGIPPTAVGPYGYADKDWNQITGGSFLTGMNSLEMLINYTYTYKPQDMPNIASALKKAAAVQVDGSLTTVIISASAGADDVTKAVPFSNSLKEEGAVVTLMLGGNGDLSALASDPSLALTSASFTPDRSVIAKIASVLCVPYTPPSTAATTTQSTTSTMSTGSTSTTPSATTTVTLTPSIATTSTQSTSPSTATHSTTRLTTTFVPDASYNPSMADIVIIFDVSFTVNASELTAQKTLVSSLVTNWNHFERVALMDFASQAGSVSNYGDIKSTTDVNGYMQAVNLLNSSADLSSALKFAKKYYTIEAGMPGRNVVLLTSSTATAAAAQPSATALHGDGKVVIVSLAMQDNSPLMSLASPNSLVAFNDFNDVTATAGKINQLLGTSTITTKATTVSTTATVPISTTIPITTVATHKSSTSTLPSTTTVPETTTLDNRYIPTEADLVIVFDVSLAANGTISAQENLVTALVAGWTHFERVAIMDFCGQPIPVTQYGTLTSAASVQQSFQDVLQQYTQPNLALAMQWIPKYFPMEQGMSVRNIVFLTTTSNNAADAQTFANSLKSQGSLIMVAVGSFDTKPLNSLATSVVSFSDFSKTATTAAQINKLL